MEIRKIVFSLFVALAAYSCTVEPVGSKYGADDDIVLKTQAEVDKFAAESSKVKEGLTVNSLTISGRGITTIADINVSVVNILTIEKTSIVHLKNTQLERVGQLLEITGNELLKSISALSVVECSGDIFITDNPKLQDISGLLYLEQMSGRFLITGNYSLGAENGTTDIAYGFNVLKSLIDNGIVNASDIILRDNSSDAVTDASMIGSGGIPEYEQGSGDPRYEIKDGKITEYVLKQYLAKAITEAEFLANSSYSTDGYWGTEDDERMLLNIGAKFVGRAMYSWNKELYFTNSGQKWFDVAKEKIQRMHAVDPDMIFQAGLFETVSEKVNYVPIPSWVFQAFGKTPESRNFKYDDIKDENGAFLGQWGAGTCVPDMSREETQMWFYFMAVRYMEIGIEALHFGQVGLMTSMGDSYSNYAGMKKLLDLVRQAAKKKARRGLVIVDAHTPGIVVNGTHLFDFSAYPIRLKEVPGSTQMAATIEFDYLDTIIGKTKSGTTPSGWYTKHIPYLVEFDNFGTSNHPGTAADDIFCWGYDEISWIANVSEKYASEFITYAVNWFEENDDCGHLEMPGLRVAAGASKSPYRCNTLSASCPTGRNLEETIKKLWAD